MKQVNLPPQRLKPFLLTIDKFNGGTLTNTSEARTDKKFAIESNNLQQYSDGIWRTRPGTDYYGVEIAGVTSIDGAIEFEKTDGTRETIAIAGGKAWKSQDGGAWTEITGATFTAGYTPYFLQQRGNLYISNRYDPLAFYDGTSLAKFTALANPDAPNTATRATLTTGTFNNHYRIQYVNTVGFTEPSASLNITTNKDRTLWATGEYVGFTLPSTPATVTGIQIFWGETDGEENLIAELAPTATTFSDTGVTAYPVNPYIETADDNTTAAPKFGAMEISGNRMWGTNDPDNQWRVYASGTGTDFARFSSFYGGAYVDLEKGGKYKPVSVIHYRTGKGDPIVTILCKSPDGQGTTFQVELTTTTVGDVAFATPIVYKIVGSIGSDAPLGVIKAGNNLMFPNKKGAYLLRNQAQLYQVLSSDDTTYPIRNKWEGINQSLISQICGYYRPPCAYYCLPIGTANDNTIVYDFEKNNWAWSWSIGFKQLFEYTDNTDSKTTHFLGVPTTGNRLIEISENFTGDFGSAFYQSYISPLIPLNEKLIDKGKVKFAIFELGNFTGSVICEVLGLTDSGIVSTVGTKSAVSTTGTSGIGDDPFSDIQFSDTSDTPSTFTLKSQKVTVRVQSRIKAIQFKVSSNTLTKFELLKIQSEGISIPGRPIYN